jgi:proteic killer suppression protein
MFRRIIRSFRGRNTKLIFEGRRVRGLPQSMRQRARQRLAVLHAATSIGDLAPVPGNRLERPQGDLAGWCSIRFNRQWRGCFRWLPPNAFDVDIVDYH